MVKLKNDSIPRAFSETDLYKQEYFKEPHGMVDIDLENVIFNKLQMDLFKSSKRKRRIALPLFVFMCFVVGALVCFLLTVVILNVHSFPFVIIPETNNSNLLNNITDTNSVNEDKSEYSSQPPCALKRKRRYLHEAEEERLNTKFEDKFPIDHDISNSNNQFLPSLRQYVDKGNDISPYFNNTDGTDNVVNNGNVSNLYSETSNIFNKNGPQRICPTFNSPAGYPVLQRQVFNSNQASLQSGQLPSQFAYTQSFSQAPSYYSNPTVQSSYSDHLKTINGRTYICHPVVTFDKDTSSTEEPLLQLPLLIDDKNNKTRDSRTCPAGEISCEDDSKCIKVHQRCDAEVNCKDASDEAFCPCKTRLSKSRICDGYVDCPNGEDELRCFGCELGTFSCDDWSPRVRESTCIPIEQRCDGITQCPTDKDELDCSLLVDSFSTNQHFAVSKAVGFLYKNVRGRWYPACHNTELWANEACKSEIGPNTIAPLIHLVPASTNYNGFYASGTENDVKIVDSCENGASVFIECPPLVCGLRIKHHNPFRREEVDTSAEEMLGQTENESVKNNDNVNDPILGSGRVVGGKPSQPKAWPWIVSVYRNGVFHCGGALINEFWIVSAAHCVDKYWRYYYEIQAGVLRRYSYSPMVQNRVVSNIVAHQFYDKRKLKNDIALMKLSKPVEFNRYVRPICLPSEITAGKNFLWGPTPGTLCTAVGWGAMVEHGIDPDHLREVQVPVHKKCKHQEDEEGREICAGLREGGKDACQGDSGGPFMCRNPNVPNQWYLAGIVSHGEGCARPNEPGVYTRVSLFLEWIFEHIHANVLPARKPLHHCPGYVCKDTKTCLSNKRRCDKIVDCLQGDDETNCESNTFTDIFKHAMRNMFLRDNAVEDEINKNVNKTLLNDDFNLEIDKDKIANFGNTSSIIPEKLIPKILNSNTTANTEKVNQNIDITANSEDFQTNKRPDSSNNNNSSLEIIPNVTTVLPPTKSTKSSPIFITPSWNLSKIERSSTTFKCKTILQTIELSKTCDRKADCEDATDEQNCLCVDYLKHNFPNTICDGETDCLDGSDEHNCSVCTDKEHHCRRSNVCVEKSKVCDNIPDCPSHEDEMDCFALTDGKTIKLDEDLRPYINKSGVISINHNGVWRIFCSNWTHTKADVAADICFYLGFSDYSNFVVTLLQDVPLQIEHNSSLIRDTLSTSSKSEKCMGLSVKCSNKIDVKHRFHENDFKTIINETPWTAEVYVEGVYKCIGTLLETEWVITANECLGDNFRLHKEYVAVLLGNTKSYLNVINPHQQIVTVVDLLKVDTTNIVLLRLEKKINVTRYVRPIGFDVKNHAVGEVELCLAQGGGTKNNTMMVYFKSLRNCTEGKRCFEKDTIHLDNCQQGHMPWSGSIVCRSVHGWYPAAVYHEFFGGCSFPQRTSYTNIFHWKADILKLMNQVPFTIDPPPCKGVRCTLGNCVPLHKVCDGVVHCPDGSDESNCTVEKSSVSKTCLNSELRCKNGKCVSKSSFCDHINDCGDWTDEPDVCNCASYLNVTHPERVCDGIRNCQDRSDENPNLCQCTSNKFVCERSRKCVSQDVVCDGLSDCPHGEDEIECLSLLTTPDSNVTEVYIQTAGVWHSGCFPQHLTTLQLEEVCTKIGYNGKSAKRIETQTNTTRQGVSITTEPFSGIWIRPTEESKLLITMRDGFQPYVRLKPDPSCYRLFLHCL